MQQRHAIRWAATLATAVAAAGVAGCDAGLTDQATANCFSQVTGYTSPAPGALTLQGHFFDTESILVRDASTHAQVAGGTPATDRTSFTFTGMVSGTYYYEVIASCEKGQTTLATETYVVK